MASKAAAIAGKAMAVPKGRTVDVASTTSPDGALRLLRQWLVSDGTWFMLNVLCALPIKLIIRACFCTNA